MRLAFMAFTVLCACPAGAASAHLLVTEVGYDVVDETSPTAEFVEIINPGPGSVDLADVWLANDEEAYPLLVNGPLSSGVSLFDFLYRFPDITISPGQVLVICDDSDAFLAEHFAGSLQTFEGQPGGPVLVETTADGPADGVPDMIDYGSNEPGTLSMANNGECVGLVTWDGVSDRVADLDWVCWLHMNRVPNKDVDYPFGIDGPDPDFDSSWFLDDLGTGTPAPDAPEGSSIHRTALEEIGEPALGGNGATGHDETCEDWSSWVVGAYSPGVAGFSTVSVDVLQGHSDGIRLHAVSPNPFTHTTQIRLTLPAPADTRVWVFDVSGRRVASLHTGHMSAGTHVLRWAGRSDRGVRLRPGVYGVALEHAGRRVAHKILLIR